VRSGRKPCEKVNSVQSISPLQLGGSGSPVAVVVAGASRFLLPICYAQKPYSAHQGQRDCVDGLLTRQGRNIAARLMAGLRSTTPWHKDPATERLAQRIRLVKGGGDGAAVTCLANESPAAPAVRIRVLQQLRAGREEQLRQHGAGSVGHMRTEPIAAGADSRSR